MRVIVSIDTKKDFSIENAAITHLVTTVDLPKKKFSRSVTLKIPLLSLSLLQLNWRRDHATMALTRAAVIVAGAGSVVVRHIPSDAGAGWRSMGGEEIGQDVLYTNSALCPISTVVGAVPATRY